MFIDEIQNVDEFELVINSFRATHDVSIFITGSNSKLLSGELATHLSGRTILFRVMPFSFKEYCQCKKENGSVKSREALLDEYIKWGSFPLVCKEEEESSKEVILSNIFDSVVLKDIVMRNKVASPVALEKVVEYVVANSATTISGNGIAAALADEKQTVSAPTIYDYLRYNAEACVCDKVSRYDIRGKKCCPMKRKHMCVILGFSNSKRIV